MNRNLNQAALGRDEDWLGNNAAVHCPICRKLFIVSHFINKGRRKCPKCNMSTLSITKAAVTLTWPGEEDEPRIVSRMDLEFTQRLDEFIALVHNGGAVSAKSVGDKLPRAYRVAFIERANRMVAVGALKEAVPGYAQTLSLRTGYLLHPRVPEIGYVAVSPTWQGIGLASKVVATLLNDFGDGNLFATTSEPTMKGTLARRGFRWVGNEWPSEQYPEEKLSLWIRG